MDIYTDVCPGGLARCAAQAYDSGRVVLSVNSPAVEEDSLGPWPQPGRTAVDIVLPGRIQGAAAQAVCTLQGRLYALLPKQAAADAHG